MIKSIIRFGILSGLTILPASVAVAAESGVNALHYPGPTWSPYVVGAGIGVLSWLTFYFSDNPIGASSFYAHIAGFVGKLIAPNHTKSLAYFETTPPRVSWEFVFVASKPDRRTQGDAQSQPIETCGRTVT